MSPRRWHSFDVVVRVLAERLDGLTPSDELRILLDGDALDWEQVVEEASEQFALPAFAAALHDLGLAAGLEPELREFLCAVHVANLRRNAKLRAQLAGILAVLNQAGIEPVVLKGAIRLADQLYPDLGWRMMQDLDVLVPKAKLMDAVRAVRETGYALVSGLHRGRPASDHHHYPGLMHPDHRVSLELHTELFPPMRQRRLLLHAAEVLQCSRPIEVDGMRACLPSPEHQMIHLIGHCQVAHYGQVYGRIDLRDRLEAAALVRRSPGTLLWAQILAPFKVAGYQRPLLTFLLSLRDGGLCTPPTLAQIDPLTALQAWRIRVQARSATIMRFGRRAAWLHEELLERVG